MHIDEHKLDQFQNGHMDTEEMIALLEHLDHCDFCMEQMLAQEEQLPAAQAPAYLKTQILQNARSPEVRSSRAILSSSRRIRLFYDSLHTAAGVLMALFMLFSFSQTDFNTLYTKEPIQREIPVPPETGGHKDLFYDFSRKISQELNDSAGMISDCLNDFSNKLVNGGK